MRRRLHLFVIPLAAILCVAPLLRHGPSCGHDFDFHLISWLDASRQIASGNLYPHWAYTPAFSAGEPRFVFYPPISWMLGAALTLLLSTPHLVSQTQAITLAPILFTAITLCSAGLAMHALARRYANPAVALLVSVLYLSNPYTLFTAYERSAFAELLAATWMPILLLAILPCPQGTRSAQPASPLISVPLLAAAVALLWLTNAPAAVMGCYTVVVVALLRLAHLYRAHRSIRLLLAPAAQLTAGTALGLGLAAFYIVPAAYERRWVQIAMANVPGMRISDSTLFHQTGGPFHDAVVRTASIVATLLLATAAIAIFVAWNRSRRHRLSPDLAPNLVRLLATSTAVIAFLLTPGSLLIWRYVPQLNFLQFPWRLTAILAVTLSLAVALALRSLSIRPAVSAALSLLLCFALSETAFFFFHQDCDAPDTPAAQLALVDPGTGAEPTDEYTPSTADNDSLRPDNPSVSIVPSRSTSVPLHHGQSPSHLDLDLQTPATLTLNLRDYPAWSITRNGLAVSERVEREDGLIAFHLPAGTSHIDIRYRTTPDRILGEAISIASFGVFAASLYTGRRSRQRSAQTSLARAQLSSTFHEPFR